MATSLQGLTLYAAPAGADLTGAVFKFARIDTNGNIVVADGHSSPTVGVVIEGAALGNPVTVQMDGIGKVTVGTGAITAGSAIESHTDGTAIAGAEGDADGVALNSGSPGEVISVRLLT
jgi:hypothetical protein